MRPAMTLAPLALALTAACELPTQELSPLLPDQRLLVEQNDATAQARTMGEPSLHAQTLSELTTQSNEGVGQILDLVQMITNFPASWISPRGDEVIWGPYIVEDVAAQLFIREQTDAAVSWGIQLRPDGEEDWTDALLGTIEPGATPELSTGTFTMDFSAASLLAIAGDLEGQVAVSYDLRAAGARTDIAFGGLTGTEGKVPVDGAVHFDYDRGVGGHMDATLSDDVDGSGSSAEETVALHSRWDDQGAGRTDALLTGGDLGTDAHVESECWSAAHTVVFHSNTLTGMSTGDETACAFAEAEVPTR